MKRLSISIVALFALAVIMISPGMQAFAATLTNEIVEPSNNLFSLESHYVIGFTTATAGTIKVITITFPTGFNIANAKLIMASGISSGGISVAGQTLTFTVNSAVSVPLGTNIIIDFGKIVNNAVVSNTISITTKDSLNNIIDGPNTSPAFTLTSVSSTMLGTNAVTSTKIANGAVTNTKIANNVINSTQLQNGAVTNTKIAKNVINSTQIIDSTIVNADISPTAAILLTKLAVGLLPSGITINSANIVDGSITGADIAAGTITADKMSTGIQVIDCTKLVPGANLMGCDLHGGQLVGLDLHGVNLSGANLYQVNFYLTNLSYANLSDANLNGSSLDTANLSYANLSDANLYNSYMVNANLFFANLSDATSLYNANLSGVNFAGANLSDASFDGSSNQPTGNILCRGTPIGANFFCVG